MKMTKKNILVLVLLSIVLATCVENHVLPKFGNVKIISNPEGAKIFKDGEDTKKITPAEFNELLSDTYIFSLKLNSFFDTTFTIEVNSGTKYTEDIFLTEQNPKGKITLTSNPTGAKVFFDGKDTGKKTPATFDKLQRGDYVFTLKLNLYEDHNVNISLTQNETIERNTKLVIAGSAGSLFVTSNPIGATIILDGNETGLVTPDTLVPVSAGQHSIKFSLENYRDTTITTTVVAGSLVEESVVLTVYEPRGSITLDSEPQGAAILLNDNSTGLFTPAKITKLEAGDYKINLSLENYYDSTFTVTVIEDQNTTYPIVTLREIPFVITLSSTPPEGGSTSGGGGFNSGDNVTVIATPNTGYNFINWTENGNEVSTNSTYTFFANKDRDLVANFSLINYTISAMSNPVGASIITGTGQYEHFDEVTLITKANPGYRFINWTENGSEVSTSLTYTFTANSDRNLIANYVLIGNLKVISDPEGAEIYLNNETTNMKTPHTFNNILAGQYILTLKLKDFADTTLTVLVNRNQTTNIGTIFLRDIVPSVKVDLSFRNDSGQIIFLYSFNQDITLDKVVLIKPDGETRTQHYFGQSYHKGFVIKLPYPEKIIGTWQFEFFGNKAGGRKVEFKIKKDLLVN